jgi:hypothetical protein
MTDNVWGYQAESGHETGVDLTGFKVEASDGSIGKIDKHSDDVGAAYIVVDTGVWIFGKQVLLPVGVISSIDVAERKTYVGRTKDEIKGSRSSTRTSTPGTRDTTGRSVATTRIPASEPHDNAPARQRDDARRAATRAAAFRPTPTPALGMRRNPRVPEPGPR